MDENNAFETRSATEVLSSLEVDHNVGLSEDEVIKRREKHGPNKLAEKKSDPWYKILWGNIKDPMTGILAVAAILRQDGLPPSRR